MSKPVNPVIEQLTNIIKSSKLTFEERLAVVQDVKLIKKYYESDKMDLLSGLIKIQESFKISKKLVKENVGEQDANGLVFVNAEGSVLRGYDPERIINAILSIGNPIACANDPYDPIVYVKIDTAGLYVYTAGRIEPDTEGTEIPSDVKWLPASELRSLLETSVDESKEIPSHVVKFKLYVNESIKVLREELAEKLMKPVFEADEGNAGADKEGNLQKGEGETDLEFKKRGEEQAKVQTKNVDEFEKAQLKMKKGETKPLAKALRAKGMSQQELADELGVHKSTISRLKTGKRNPSFEMMSELGDTFGSVENLFPELK